MAVILLWLWFLNWRRTTRRHFVPKPQQVRSTYDALRYSTFAGDFDRITALPEVTHPVVDYDELTKGD